MNCGINYNLLSKNALAAALFRHAHSSVVSREALAWDRITPRAPALLISRLVSWGIVD
ncbi:hypothetical protein YM3MPS_54920 [Mycobacterium pseudoshottsii]|nr:hypothetical protein [Mycobacterium pseudoshottsii]RFZ62806.1 hypothetical protein DL240490_02912 [Mycobacterium marinum]BEH79689.1 hypothetical protein YM3MPS_54920 [Mycobacterium pseudoshottsii]